MYDECPIVCYTSAVDIPFTSFSHPPAATVDAWRPYVEQHAKPGSKICKNLFLKDKKGKLVLCTALSETNTDLKYLQEKLKVCPNKSIIAVAKRSGHVPDIAVRRQCYS